MLTLGNASRLLNWLTGGERGQTLCARVAARYGADCLFCRLVSRFTEPGHCAEEMMRDATRQEETR